MTIASLLVGTIAGQILFVLTKIFAISSFNMESWVVVVLFWLALVIETIAVVRRMGTLNYFESLFLVAVWLIVTLIVDFAITTRFTSMDVYTTLYFWVATFIIPLSVFLFHKKVHVEARRERAS